jgi:ribosome assembly protein YihI (activator of Der GTPase)
MAMKKNGRIREKGYKLILENKNVWLDVQEADLNLKIVDQAYFDSVMDDIDKRIFRY